MDDSQIKRSALLIVPLASFLTPFMVSSINIALPSMGSEFGMSALLMSWVATSYSLAAAVFLVPFGRLADIHGRRRIFSYGIGIFTLSSLLLAFSPSAAVLIALRVLQGCGSAMIFGTGIAILSRVFPANERGRVLGINVASIYVGLSVGPVLGGFLTQQFGWRSIFLVNVPLGLLVLYFVTAKLRLEWADARGEAFDLTGAVMYGLTLVALMRGLSLLPAFAGYGFVLVGALGMAAFVVWEKRAASPLLDIALFQQNRAFALSNLAAFIMYSATFGVMFLMSLYLQYITGLTPRQAGMVLISQPVVMAVFSPLAGRLSDRVEPRLVATSGIGITTAGLFLLTFIGSGTRLSMIVAALLLIGFGIALFSSPNTNAIMSSIEKRHYGVGSATRGTMRLTGQMMSMGIAMLVFSVHIGSARITPEYYPAFLASAKTAFVIFTALCFSGTFVSLMGGRRAGRIGS